MNNVTKMMISGIACIGLMGCGDSYDDKNDDALKVLNRNAKFLTDTNGMSLYIFDKDSLNMSNCDAECQKIWPLFLGANTGSVDIKVLEGTDHLAYRSHPLYFFASDTVVGDILGNNVKNVWHLVYAIEGTTDMQTAFSQTIMKQTYLTDNNGRALYVFDKDDINVSNCYDSSPTSNLGCESTWPVFYSANLGTLPTGTTQSDFGVINRNTTKAKAGEPLQQVTYKGKPLYYFTPDNKETGNIKGDWVGGVWHLIELGATKVDSTQSVSVLH